jgi:hypothetical protein
MRIDARSVAVVLCLLGVVIAPAAMAAEGDAIVTDALTAPEMQPVSDARLAVVFAVPDLDLSTYHSVMLAPVTVSYQRGGAHMYRLSEADMQTLQRHGAAALEKQLAGDGRYKVVTEPGPGTLIVRASLQNVWLAFAEDAVPGRTQTFGEYAVKMSLEAELVDSQTNQVLMIVADRQGDRLNPDPRQITGVDAWEQVDKAFNYWAEVLRKRLDGARKP